MKKFLIFTTIFFLSFNFKLAGSQVFIKAKVNNKIITNIDINTNVSKENFCCVLFFKNADLIAIIKSSLLDAIFLNIQSTSSRMFALDQELFQFQLLHKIKDHLLYVLVNQFL